MTPTPPNVFDIQIMEIKMGTMKVRGNAIWIKHILYDETLRRRPQNLVQNQTIRLEVAGIADEWAKMRDGKDGRITAGIRPEGKMMEVWKQFQNRRGELVEISALESTDDYPKSVQETLDEWSSSDDNEAFCDLQDLLTN